MGPISGKKIFRENYTILTPTTPDRCSHCSLRLTRSGGENTMNFTANAADTSISQKIVRRIGMRTRWCLGEDNIKI